MNVHHGYRYEGLAVLIIWAVFIALAVVFEDAARRLLPWAFLLLMIAVTGLSIAGEVMLYRQHVRAHRPPD